MATHYRKLFMIQFLNNYYSSGLANDDFSVKPSSHTAALFKDANILNKVEDQGHLFYYRARLNGVLIQPSVPTTDIADGTHFHFYIELKNSLLFNFADLGSGVDGEPLKGKVLYATSNGGVETPATGGGWVASVALPQAELLTVYSAAFAYDFTVTGSPEEVVVKVYDAAAVEVKQIRTKSTTRTGFYAMVDLTGFPEGRYSIKRFVGGVEDGIETPFYVSDEVAMNPPFAILAISKSVIWDDIQTHNEPDGKNDFTIYKWSFNERKVTWKFKIIFSRTTYTTDPADYSITDDLLTSLADRYNTANIADQFFFEFQEESTVNGKPALVFQSTDGAGNEKEYPLYQEAKHDLILKKGTAKLISGLPNPDIRTLTPEIILFI
jgi:hypothetical protein